MARKRSITSAMGTDERIEQIANEDQLSAMMWPWLLTAFDDWGRLDITSIGRIRMEIFPAFQGVTNATIIKAIDAYASTGIVYRYTCAERTYLAIRPRRWMKWQTYLQGSKRAAAEPTCPMPADAPWSEDEEQALAMWLTKPAERTEPKNLTDDSAQEEMSARNEDCLQTSADNRECQAMSVPYPSPSPYPSALAKNVAPFLRKSADASSAPDDRFEQFWAAYPRKRSKGDAQKAWSKIKPDDDTFAQILSALEASKTSHDWTKANGQYVPYPASWLRAQGWMDEISPAPAGPQNAATSPGGWYINGQEYDKARFDADMAVYRLNPTGYVITAIDERTMEVRSCGQATQRRSGA